MVREATATGHKVGPKMDAKPIFKGEPVLAVIWSTDKDSEEIEEDLKSHKIPVASITPTKRAGSQKDWIVNLYKRYMNKTVNARTISDEQMQIRESLRPYEEQVASFNEWSGGGQDGEIVILQEVHACSVIDASSVGEHRPPVDMNFDIVAYERQQPRDSEVNRTGRKTERWEPILIIEYDGSQHSEEKQSEADARKNALCCDAGLPLLRVHKKFLPPSPRYHERYPGQKRRQEFLNGLMSQAIEFASQVRAEKRRRAQKTLKEMGLLWKIRREKDPKRNADLEMRHFELFGMGDIDDPKRERASREGAALKVLERYCGSRWTIEYADRPGGKLTTWITEEGGRSRRIKHPDLELDLHAKLSEKKVEEWQKDVLFMSSVSQILEMAELDERQKDDAMLECIDALTF